MGESEVDLFLADINYVGQIKKWLDEGIENCQINSESNFVLGNGTIKIVDKLLKNIINVIKEGSDSPDAICNNEETTNTHFNYTLKKNLHRLYFSETDLSKDLPLISVPPEQNPAVTYFETDQILCNNLTTMVKIATDSVKLLSTSTQSKETKSSCRMSNIRKSEGPFVNLIDLSTPIGKLQRKYIAPRKILKEPLTLANSTKNVNLINEPSTPKLMERHKPLTINLTPPQYTSSPESNLNTNMCKNRVFHDSLTTIIKVANDLVHLISKCDKVISKPAQVESRDSHLIDITTPTQAYNKRKVLTPSRSRLIPPKKMLKSTCTTAQGAPKQPSNLLSARKKSTSDANLTITIKK